MADLWVDLTADMSVGMSAEGKVVQKAERWAEQSVALMAVKLVKWAQKRVVH